MPPARLLVSCCAALALSSALRAWAEPPPAAGVSTQPAPRADRAAIVLVGEAGESPPLRALLIDLLEQQNVAPELVVRGEFGRDDLLAGSGREGVVRVFIVPRAERSASLYFRAPDGERFLLREVDLPSGFDDIGRELIGQIVASAVVALLRSSAGVTRAEAKAVLDRDMPESEAATAPKTTAPPPAPFGVPPPNPTDLHAPNPTDLHARPVSALQARPMTGFQARPTSPTSIEGWFALRYGAQWSGSALGLGHGPGIELGAGLRRSLLIRGRLSGEGLLPEVLRSSVIDATVAMLRWRLALDLGLPLGAEYAIVLSAGAGEDISRIDPGPAHDATVLAVPAFWSRAPEARGELRLEGGSPSIQFALAVYADAALVDTHYDLVHRAGTERLAEPWPLRPGVALAIAWHPRWGGF